MYTEYFGLRESPFSIAPDPRFLYMSEQHREALAHLVFGLNSYGGFVLLTGEIGTGKTTVCRCLLEQVPQGAETAFIFNPRLTVIELLETICDEFGIKSGPGRESIKTYVDSLNSYLLEIHGEGKKAILIIDEAQNLSADLLEQLRLLTNLETNQRKLLQIILMGQPELREKLAAPELKQLSQRIVARYHLGPLTSDETALYVAHRLTVAGCSSEIFTARALRKIYTLSAGVPRLINLICDRALLAAFSEELETIRPTTIKKAAAEVFGMRSFSGLRAFVKPAAGLAAILAVLVLIALIGRKQQSPDHSADQRDIPAESIASASMPSEETNLNITAKPVISEDIKFTSNREKALMDLSRLWKIDPPLVPSRSICSQVSEHGLACYRDSGTLETILRMNRPTVLELSNVEGKKVYAVFKFLNNDTATVIQDGREINVPVKKIISLWFGRYTIIWKLPPEYRRDISRGAGGPVIKWLDEKMSSILGRPVRADNPVYDDDFIREIKKFQMANGLKPDGIAGKKTLIMINSYTESNIPLLAKKVEG